jgi:hypothetical protein
MAALTAPAGCVRLSAGETQAQEKVELLRTTLCAVWGGSGDGDEAA